MANVRHSQLTGSDLHEPKGVADAEKGMVYYAKGTGTGEWAPTTRLLTIKSKNTVQLPIKTSPTILPASSYNTPIYEENIDWNADRAIIQYPGLYRIRTGLVTPQLSSDSETGVYFRIVGFEFTHNGSLVSPAPFGWELVTIANFEAGDIVAPVYGGNSGSGWSNPLGGGNNTVNISPTYLIIEGIGGE